MKQHYLNMKGFSLVEMSIAMIISGFLFIAATNVYRLSLQQGYLDAVFVNIQELEGGLIEFRDAFGRYPCPADPALTSGDINYGLEDCALNIVASAQDANGDFLPDNVLIGSFPFDTIMFGSSNNKVTAANIRDPWNNKLTYAVTENLTRSLTFNDFWGAISVVDEYDNSIITPSDRAHLVIYSHGENGRGAYSLEGVPVDPFVVLPPCVPGVNCPPPGAPVVNEIENANQPVLYDSKFLAGIRNESLLFRNDDTLRFMMTRSSGLWNIVGVAPGVSPVLYLITNSNPGDVGVGIKNPTEQLDVSGNVKADTLRATDFCDESGSDCMPISRIAGNDPEMQCAPGKAIELIADNQVICLTVFANPVAVACNQATEYMNGFTSLGVPICELLPP